MFDLPSRLNELIEINNSYSTAVKCYCKARKTLDHYKHMPTFKSIEDDCSSIIHNLKQRLYERIDQVESTNEIISESINLLNQLGEPIDILCTKYITRIEKCLDNDLSLLVINIDLISNSNKNASEKHIQNEDQIAMDILEFVDYGCNHFLANLSVFIQSYNTLFIDNNSFIK